MGADGLPLYPYRNPAVEALLTGPPDPADGPAWTALGAALTVLAAKAPAYHEGVSAEINAGPAAFAVLNATDGGCATQLNLLLLLTADSFSANAVSATQQRRAEDACQAR
jgi:hypothetical protein